MLTGLKHDGPQNCKRGRRKPKSDCAFANPLQGALPEVLKGHVQPKYKASRLVPELARIKPTDRNKQAAPVIYVRGNVPELLKM